MHEALCRVKRQHPHGVEERVDGRIGQSGCMEGLERVVLKAKSDFERPSHKSMSEAMLSVSFQRKMYRFNTETLQHVSPDFQR